MPKIKTLIAILLGVMVIYLVVFGILIWLVFPKLDSPATAGIIGAFGGAIAGVAGAAVTAIAGVWDRTKDAGERLKDRVSSHALELTKMDYELRQKSLELTKRKQKFLAPIKVYREIYKALLELHEEGTWPKSIEELGFLNIFELGTEESQQKSEAEE